MPGLREFLDGDLLVIHRRRQERGEAHEVRLVFQRRRDETIRVHVRPEVDHIELFGPPMNSWARSRNFVLCPGKAYDRSPCGTGTSAKLACLAADSSLDEDQPWVQEGILGSLFTARYRWLDRAAGTIVPTIIGTAFVTAESTLWLDESDPFCWGISR